MAQLKTRPTSESVQRFLDSIEDERRRDDCKELVEIMSEATGEEPIMWGPGMVGFGSYHYRYDSGHEGDYFVAGFSPRKRNLSLYLMSGVDSHPQKMSRLGRHKTGKSCIYINRLDDIDRDVLKEVVVESVEIVRQRYG